jgi:hypothetical protein
MIGLEDLFYATADVYGIEAALISREGVFRPAEDAEVEHVREVRAATRTWPAAQRLQLVRIMARIAWPYSNLSGSPWAEYYWPEDFIHVDPYSPRGE